MRGSSPSRSQQGRPRGAMLAVFAGWCWRRAVLAAFAGQRWQGLQGKAGSARRVMLAALAGRRWQCLGGDAGHVCRATLVVSAGELGLIPGESPERVPPQHVPALPDTAANQARFAVSPAAPGCPPHSIIDPSRALSRCASPTGAVAGPTCRPLQTMPHPPKPSDRGSLPSRHQPAVTAVAADGGEVPGGRRAAGGPGTSPAGSCSRSQAGRVWAALLVEELKAQPRCRPCWW